MNIEMQIKKSKIKIDENRIKYDEEFKKYTSFKIGGKADCLIKVETEKELLDILDFVKENKIELTVLGNCTNVLISDKGIRGITLFINFDKIEKKEKKEIEEKNKEKEEIEYTLGAGVKIGLLSRMLLKESIAGFEELAGIPGTIAGAVVMNAGAHGKEICDIIKTVKCMDYDGNIHIFKKEELEFSYRNSRFKSEKYIILEVDICLEKGNYEQIENKMKEYMLYRKEKQPIEFSSAGSTFKRGNDYITAKLIDEVGLKGLKIGGAEVSNKHAGFIINTGDATFGDVVKLIEKVKEVVYNKTNKKIELEIEIIGEI